MSRFSEHVVGKVEDIVQPLLHTELTRAQDPLPVEVVLERPQGGGSGIVVAHLGKRGR